MRRRPAVLVLFAVIGIIGILILLLGPLAQWATVAGSDLKGKEKADAVNATRQTLLAAAGGAVAIIGLGFTARTYYLSRRGQFTDRNAKAIAQLASDKITERLGGIYSLEHLMAESERDHITVVEVLAAFIREQSTLPQSEHVQGGSQPVYGRLATDVQVALTALSRRPQRPERTPIDLSTADLRKADLAGARLDKANLQDTRLEGANLSEAHLNGVNLTNARLEGADLRDARLGSADLRDAHLEEAKLGFAYLGPSYHIAGLLLATDLSGAHLNGADLYGAFLEGAYLHGADFEQTNLANTRFAKASATDATRWPDEFDWQAAGIELVNSDALET